MVERSLQDEESYELSATTHDPHPDDFDYSSSFEDDGARAGLLTEQQHVLPPRTSVASFLARFIPFPRRRSISSKFTSRNKRPRVCLRPSALRRIALIAFGCLTSIVFLTAVFFPSYTNPPPHYAAIRAGVGLSDVPGRANPDLEKVFIAASIFDRGGHLVNGAWGESVLGLIDILGPNNVYLSIYENDAGQEAKDALEAFRQKVACAHSITFDERFQMDEVPHIRLPDGSDRIKRIEYLSAVRNRALIPLQDSIVKFDRLLYLNDVIFDPVEAAQLLLATNLVDNYGRADYRAACAVDFINPIKYYDTFATRDYEGYGIGLPFYPWYTTAGQGISRKDVYANSDAVRVRSCWGGMVAFDAAFFMKETRIHDLPPTAGGDGPKNMTIPYQFRAEEDLYWDASECCLIHADIQNPDSTQSGIYMNPYIRVAYDKRTLSWLGFSRRFERLLSPIHYLLSKLVGMPWYNPRQFERSGATVSERVWIPDLDSPDGGSFQNVERTASHSGFCGRRALQVLKTDITAGEKNWEFLPVPA